MAITIHGNGQVIKQVVNFTSTTVASTTSTSYVDVAGFSATITPTNASNKILVLVSAFTSNGATNYYTWIQVTRSGVVVIKDIKSLDTNLFNLSGQVVAAQQLDSPATTSPVTYQIQLKCDNGGAGTAYINRGAGGGTSIPPLTLTLLEVAYA